MEVETQPNKRFCRDASQTKIDQQFKTCRSSSNHYASNDGQKFIPSIHALASDIFLTSLRDIKLLKTCRLVCKFWNITACESLRTCSIVTLRESKSAQLVDFTAVLLRRSFGPLQHLPSPFANFHAKALTFTDTTFINLTLQPNVAIRNLLMTSFVLNDNIDSSQLLRVLAANKTSITNLNISGLRRLELFESLLENDDIILTSLKRFQFYSSREDDEDFPIWQKILSKCKLESIGLEIEEGELLHLDITYDECVLPETFEHLSSLRFPSLRSLTLEARGTADPDVVLDNLQELLTTIGNVSPCWEKLATDVPISFASDLRFPKLQKIKVANNNDLSFFTPDKFPCLSEVSYIYSYPLMETLQSRIVPHRGVKSLLITANDFFSYRETFSQDLVIFLKYVGRQFPNVTSLEFFTMKIRGTTLITHIYELSLSGIRKSMVTKYLEMGWPIEQIPRRKSLLDLTELEFISFPGFFYMKPEIIVYCLARLPKLKQLEFYWNDSLPASLLQDSVSHLEKMVILNSSESKFQAVMAEVSRMLPNAHLR